MHTLCALCSERIRLFKEWLVGRATDAANPADADSGEEPTAAEKVPSEGTQDAAKQRKRRRRRSPSEVCHWICILLLHISHLLTLANNKCVSKCVSKCFQFIESGRVGG